MKQFEYLDELTYADIAFIAYGNSIEEVFANAGLAVTDSMVDPTTVATDETTEFEIRELTLDAALFSFLEEIILLKDSDQLFLKEFVFEILEEGAMTLIKVTARGSKINPEKQTLRNDVKAITMHEFKVDWTTRPMSVQIILDV